MILLPMTEKEAARLNEALNCLQSFSDNKSEAYHKETQLLQRKLEAAMFIHKLTKAAA